MDTSDQMLLTSKIQPKIEPHIYNFQICQKVLFCTENSETLHFVLSRHCTTFPPRWTHEKSSFTSVERIVIAISLSGFVDYWWHCLGNGVLSFPSDSCAKTT